MENVNNFLTEIIDEDIANGLSERIHTRFPPEPNGYLHIGSAKAIFINWSIAKKYNGLFNLRYDDTNPVKEDTEYVDSIWEDIKWLTGEEPSGGVYYGSDYFDQCYEFALKLIREGKAYVDDLSADEMREYRGTLTEPGKESPYRNRSVEENLDLFERMKNGEFPEGKYTLRAKIDLTSGNFNMRDPVIYRIRYMHHHRQGDKWCIYPMYDFAHPIQDAIEGITFSLCSLEFENHRPLYEWVITNLFGKEFPKQREFARLNMTNTVMSKRYLRELVEKNIVDGWDDPRMPTLCGLRRRGYTPASIRDFCERIGVSKANSMVDSGLLDYCIRDDLKAKAKVVMAVLDPLKLVITNYPEDQVEMMELENNPETPELGKRLAPFTRELYIEREDFMEEPVKKFFRLAPGKEVRLKGAYFVTCTDFVKDENGVVTEVHCTYDPETRSGSGFEGRKVKGTLHWVSAKDNVQATARLYDYMMLDNPEDPNGEMIMNPNSLEVKECFIEPSVKDAKKGDRFQFMRNGYYIVDTKDTTEEHLVFNRIVPLKSSFKLK